MKTLRFTLVALIVAFTLVNVANADDFRDNPKKSAKITIANAVKIPGMVATIREQVDPGFLNTIEQLYVVKVNYQGVQYNILGSRQSWLKIFRPVPPIPPVMRKRNLLASDL
jgi:hypothetical protein